MTIIDYKKETGEFHIHVYDKILPSHIDFLKRFIPKNKKNSDISIDMGELFKDDDSFGDIHRLYYDLTDWGFLEMVYDQSEEKSTVRLTGIGKKIFEKLSLSTV